MNTLLASTLWVRLGLGLIISVFFVAITVRNRRRRFKRTILDYLENYQWCASNLYPLFESIITDNSIVATQISIAFKLSQALPRGRVYLERLEQYPTEEESIFEAILAPGDEDGGEQIFFYTFASIDGIANSVHQFERFVTEHYQSPEEIKIANDAWWKKLKSIEPPSPDSTGDGQGRS